MSREAWCGGLWRGRWGSLFRILRLSPLSLYRQASKRPVLRSSFIPPLGYDHRSISVRRFLGWSILRIWSIQVSLLACTPARSTTSSQNCNWKVCFAWIPSTERCRCYQRTKWCVSCPSEKDSFGVRHNWSRQCWKILWSSSRSIWCFHEARSTRIISVKIAQTVQAILRRGHYFHNEISTLHQARYCNLDIKPSKVFLFEGSC